MYTIKYDKLVRDLIPDIIAEAGKKPVTRILSDKKEYLNYLNTKLAEEFTEYRENGDIEELADMLEVIYALVLAKGFSIEELEELRLKKRAERGGFEKGIVLLKVQGGGNN